MAIYRVYAKEIIYYDTLVEANSPEEARKLTENGFFNWGDGFSDGLEFETAEETDEEHT